MSDADVQMTAPLPLGGSFASLGAVGVTANLGPGFALGRGIDGARDLRCRRLPMNVGQHLSDRLSRLGGSQRSLGRKRKNLHQAFPVKKARETNYIILLHERNEGTVKDLVMQCILDKDESKCLHVDIAGIRSQQ